MDLTRTMRGLRGRSWFTRGVARIVRYVTRVSRRRSRPMSTDDEKQPPILICMPWAMRHEARTAMITKGVCFVCRGEVFYNTATGLPRDVHSLLPICGACAVDLIDADEAKGEKHHFALTEPQAAGKGGINPVQRAMVRAIGMDRMSN